MSKPTPLSTTWLGSVSGSLPRRQYREAWEREQQRIQQLKAQPTSQPLDTEPVSVYEASHKPMWNMSHIPASDMPHLFRLMGVPAPLP